MAKLKFEMWKCQTKRGYMSRFTDGRGISTDSWWDSPQLSIDHVGPEYLKQPHRHPNTRNDRHINFIKDRYKVEMARLKASEGEA
ncbi:hypothetical protein NLX78_22735 [Paenibacillus sp. Lou8.1]|uniref:hypothetical protein n=1 Tax=Paenibacillus sp. Lou8.1 TaxID=2962041 RepID=UPI0020B63D9F|nr:hypothetical protein [Paenibacillus sp. Lou8.1]MCP3810040.1 hypothetical protein [Paenibacillus sp. Lou8.1]